ncbi:MAG: hypothetical protein COX19_11695, partial [Desulfobacterales bacterium CG23_combo_of_CG06-09_8_20_14_all_51_8]
MRHQKDTFFKDPFSLVLMGILLMLMIWPVVPAWAGPGDLDITFSGDGYDIVNVSPGYEDVAQAVAIDSSGRAVVAGYVDLSGKYYFMVLRYKTDGTLDETFDGDTGSGNGIVITDVSGGEWVNSFSDYASAVAIADDGDIIVAGSANDGAHNHFALVRYNNPDGTLDTGFGGNGIVTTNISGYNNGIRSISIYKSGPKAGYIVAAGYTLTMDGFLDFAIAQYTPSGDLDMDFNNPNGYLTRDFYGYDDAIYGVAIDGNNKIVVAGNSAIMSDPQFAVCRYDDTGVFDATFNSGLPYTNNLVSGTFTDEGIRAVAIQSDNKIVVTGYGINPGYAEDVVVLRLMSNGTLDDTGFASPAGYVMTDINDATHNDRGHAIALESDGDIVVGCYHLGADSEDFALLRYDTNGSLDPAFGIGGTVVTDLGGAVSEDVINGLALQADGKALVAGKSDFDTAVARYEMSTTGELFNFFVTKSGTGSGTVTTIPAGIDCGADCVGVFPKDTMIQLSAVPDSGSTFTGWTDGTGSAAGCSGTGSCSFTITQTSSIKANFGLSSVGPGTYYVNSASGNDETGDGSLSMPWQTLHHAIYQINGGTSGNYTLNVAAGEYKLLSSGGHEPDEVLHITQSNLTIDGAGSATIVDG